MAWIPTVYQDSTVIVTRTIFWCQKNYFWHFLGYQHHLGIFSGTILDTPGRLVVPCLHVTMLFLTVFTFADCSQVHLCNIHVKRNVYFPHAKFNTYLYKCTSGFSNAICEYVILRCQHSCCHGNPKIWKCIEEGLCYKGLNCMRYLKKARSTGSDYTDDKSTKYTHTKWFLQIQANAKTAIFFSILHALYWIHFVSIMSSALFLTESPVYMLRHLYLWMFCYSSILEHDYF